MRIRSIKPEFWKSTSIAQLCHFDRLLFIALWSYVDDNGVGRDIPQIINGELFALEEDPRESLARVTGSLARLSEAGRILRYTVAGRPFLAIVNWSEHQRIDKPNKSRYPGPDDPTALLTCGYGESRDILARPSRDPRESPAPGAVEQGNRGTEEEERTTLLAPRARARPPDPPGFAEFYAAYPRKQARQAAAKAYAKARRIASAETLQRGAERLRDDPTRDPAFTPYPASWLNDGRWDDEGPARPAPVNPAQQRQQQHLALVAQFAQQEHPTPHQPELGA